MTTLAARLLGGVLALHSFVVQVMAVPTALRLSSSLEDATVREAMGEYLIDGVINGHARYKRTARSVPQAGERFIFRTPKGSWAVASDLTSSRLAIMSTSPSAASPVGLSFRFYGGGGDWRPDHTLTTTDISVEMADRKRKLDEYRAAMAQAGEEAEVRRLLTEREREAVAAQEAALAHEAAAAAKRRAQEERRVASADARRAAAERQAALDEERFQKVAVEVSLNEMRQRRIDAIREERESEKAARRAAEDARLAEEAALRAERQVLPKRATAVLFFIKNFAQFSRWIPQVVSVSRVRAPARASAPCHGSLARRVTSLVLVRGGAGPCRLFAQAEREARARAAAEAVRLAAEEVAAEEAALRAAQAAAEQVSGWELAHESSQAAVDRISGGLLAYESSQAAVDRVSGGLLAYESSGHWCELSISAQLHPHS